ncbi:MAG: DUF429 domain-containing protein, partial [Bosea sp. (in: a-proteobacteria)]
NDTRKKQTTDQHEARRDLFRTLCQHARQRYGCDVEAESSRCDDPGADHLDALFCAVQAAWAWRHRENNFGAPNSVDRLEGWISDPSVL